MANQHLTLRELIIECRLQLAQPYEGTLGSQVSYARFTEAVDELKLICNSAQRATAVTCCTPTTSLLRSNKVQIPVRSGVTEYALEDDYLDIDYLIYVKDGEEYPIYPSELRGFENEESYPYSRYHTYNDKRYKYYEVSGMSSQEKEVGVIRSESLNEVHDLYNDFNGVRIGDIVHNKSDGSQGAVTEIVPESEVLNASGTLEKTRPYLKVESLTGGKSNRFLQGDEYVVSSKEELNETLHVTPKVEFDEINAKIVDSNNNQFRSQEAFILHSLDVTINTIPDNIEPDDRLVIEVLQGNNLAVKDPASFVSKVGVEKGVNRVEFDEVTFSRGLLLEEDTDYTVRATIGMTELRVNAVTVWAYGSSDMMKLGYTRLPARMTNDYDVCELPPWSLGLFYVEAKIIATQKITRRPYPEPGLINERMYQKSLIENMLWSRAEKGTSHLNEGYRNTYINEGDRGFVHWWWGGY